MKKNIQEDQLRQQADFTLTFDYLFLKGYNKKYFEIKSVGKIEGLVRY